MVVKKWLPRHSNFFANAVISVLKASAYGIDLQSQAKIARIGLSFQTFAAHVFGLLQGRQGKLLFRGLFPGLLLGRFLRTRSARG